MNNDEQYILRCNELALESHRNNDLPFGALITLDGKVIAESGNTGLSDMTGHAEINALRKVVETMPEVDISKCTIYSNFEPCAMCSFMIRDYGLARIVFSVPSPHVGGYTRWSILTDWIRPECTLKESKHEPEVVGGVLKEVCIEIFDKLGFNIHHSEEDFV